MDAEEAQQTTVWADTQLSNVQHYLVSVDLSPSELLNPKSLSVVHMKEPDLSCHAAAQQCFILVLILQTHRCSHGLKRARTRRTNQLG